MRMNYRMAVLTDVSSGIGAELAWRLAEQGVAVGLTARRVPEFEAVVVPADVANPPVPLTAIATLTSSAQSAC